MPTPEYEFEFTSLRDPVRAEGTVWGHPFVFRAELSAWYFVAVERPGLPIPEFQRDTFEAFDAKAQGTRAELMRERLDDPDAAPIFDLPIDLPAVLYAETYSGGPAGRMAPSEAETLIKRCVEKVSRAWPATS